MTRGFWHMDATTEPHGRVLASLDMDDARPPNRQLNSYSSGRNESGQKTGAKDL